jgi:hypothetical protein
MVASRAVTLDAEGSEAIPDGSACSAPVDEVPAEFVKDGVLSEAGGRYWSDGSGQSCSKSTMDSQSVPLSWFTGPFA